VLIDSSHRWWLRVTIFLFLVSAAAYVPYHLYGSVHGPRGSSWPGLAYGVASLILMIYAGLIGVRRKVRVLNLGRAASWLRGHIWLGTLSYPLAIFHAGFRFGGTLAVWLIVLFTIVLVTGIFGLVVQHLVPRFMTVQVQVETMYEQISLYVARLHEEAVRVVTEVCGALEGAPAVDEKAKGKKPVALEGSEPLKRFYVTELGTFLEDGRGRLGNVASRTAVFSQMKTLLPPTLHATLTQLEDLCEERRQLAVQVRLHRWLHGWLIIHLPAAVALLILTVVHAVASLYY